MLGTTEATNAYIQIPFGRTLTTVTPFGDPSQLGGKFPNELIMRTMNLDGSYNAVGGPLLFEDRNGKQTKALLNRLGTRYNVGKLSPQYISDELSTLVITLQLNPDTGFSGLILNYS